VRAWEQRGQGVLIHAYLHVASNGGATDHEGTGLYHFRDKKIAVVHML
jgi:hypothetical protein